MSFQQLWFYLTSRFIWTLSQHLPYKRKCFPFLFVFEVSYYKIARDSLTSSILENQEKKLFSTSVVSELLYIFLPFPSRLFLSIVTNLKDWYGIPIFHFWTYRFHRIGPITSPVLRAFLRIGSLVLSDLLQEVTRLKMLKLTKPDICGKFIFDQIWAKRAQI